MLPNAIQNWDGNHDHRQQKVAWPGQPIKAWLRLQAYFQWGPKTTKRWLWRRRTGGQKLIKRKQKKKGH